MNQSITKDFEATNSELVADHTPSSSSPIKNTHQGEYLPPISYTKTRVESVGKAMMRKNRLVGNVDVPSWDQRFKQLRTRVLHLLQANNWNAIGVVGLNAEAGNSMVTANLAITLAMEMDYSVLLVDANLHKPALHELFGMASQPGLSDFLTADRPISDCLVNPGIDKLVLLPAGQPLINATEMLGSRKMARLVNEFKSRYQSRIVIFDVPPIMNRSDALSFSPYVDAMLLVLEEGRSLKQQTKQAIDLLSGTALLGTVLNKSQRDTIRFNRS